MQTTLDFYVKIVKSYSFFWLEK